MRKNLLITSGIFHPEPGGPATYLKALLPELQVRGWSPNVLTYGDDTTETYPYMVQQVQRRRLPLRLWEYWQHSRQLVPDADLIYAHSTDLPVAWGRKPRLIKIVGDPAWERAVRMGWVASTTDIDAFQTASLGPLVSLLRASRARQVRAFDAVIVPSNYLKQMVVGWGVPEARVHVIYNALPHTPQSLFASQADARTHLGWDQRPVLLTAARLTPWKGIDHLIAALHHVPDARLLVAGDGSDAARLQTLAAPLAERVVFLGRVPREWLYQIMQAADYFVLYSGYEGLPHTILEAFLAGTPVIASDKGGNPEVVQHDLNGLLVPYINVEALAEALRHALSGGTRAQLAQGVSHNMERFGFESMVTATHQTLGKYL